MAPKEELRIAWGQIVHRRRRSGSRIIGNGGPVRQTACRHRAIRSRRRFRRCIARRFRVRCARQGSDVKTRLLANSSPCLGISPPFIHNGAPAHSRDPPSPLVDTSEEL